MPTHPATSVGSSRERRSSPNAVTCHLPLAAPGDSLEIERMGEGGAVLSLLPAKGAFLTYRDPAMGSTVEAQVAFETILRTFSFARVAATPSLRALTDTPVPAPHLPATES